jgi:hypothetical protein
MPLVNQELPMPFPKPVTVDGLTVRAGATIVGDYRFTLTREWDPRRGRLCWVMLNPSKADAYTDDPTITRCVRFAADWGFGAISVVNLFALRSTDPKELNVDLHTAIGPSNTSYLFGEIHLSLLTVAAWGSSAPRRHAGYVDYIREKMLRLTTAVQVLGVNKDGNPRHPLFAPAATHPQPWQPLIEE